MIAFQVSTHICTMIQILHFKRYIIPSCLCCSPAPGTSRAAREDHPGGALLCGTSPAKVCREWEVSLIPTPRYTQVDMGMRPGATILYSVWMVNRYEYKTIIVKHKYTVV